MYFFLLGILHNFCFGNLTKVENIQINKLNKIWSTFTACLLSVAM